MQKRLICPQRRRRVPAQFSWIDQRLVREHLIDRCSVDASALYLFLVIVGDADGLSYYAEATLAQRLSLDIERLRQARHNLMAADLIAFDMPFYQVLSVSSGKPS